MGVLQDYEIHLQGVKPTRPRCWLKEQTRWLTGQRKTRPLNSAFSPDGRWIAYTFRAGVTTVDVYVEPFPATGANYLISRGTSRRPIWLPDLEVGEIHRQVAVLFHQLPPGFTSDAPNRWHGPRVEPREVLILWHSGNTIRTWKQSP